MLVSVIIPVYNTATYLPACLDSILAQSYTDYECLLIDDGSTDGSSDICDALPGKTRVSMPSTALMVVSVLRAIRA